MLSDAQHFADEGELEMQIMNVQPAEPFENSKVLLPKVKNLISKKDKRLDQRQSVKSYGNPPNGNEFKTVKIRNVSQNN